MSILNLDYSSFDKFATQLCMHHEVDWLKQSPSEATAVLTKRIKYGSKLLSLSCDIQRTAALECLAAALGFPNWHGLSKHLAQAPNLTGREIPAYWVERLKFGLILLPTPQSNSPVPPSLLQAFEDLAFRLAAAAKCRPELVLDTVCAPLCGDISWHLVTTKSSLDTTSPLYCFDPQRGRFTASSECSELEESLYQVVQDSFQNADRWRKAISWLETAISKQPGFLEAGFRLADMQYSDGGYLTAFKTVKKFIQLAEGLIPRDFENQISWSEASNRFYIRMLWLEIDLLHRFGDIPGCLEKAEYLQSLNARDEFLVSLIYPLFLLEQGEYSQAANAAADIETGDAAGVSGVVQFFCLFAIGSHKRAVRRLVESVIDTPDVLTFLLGHGTADPEYEPVATLLNFASRSYESIPNLKDECLLMLADPFIQDALDQIKEQREKIRAKGLPSFSDQIATDELVVQLKRKLTVHFLSWTAKTRH